MQRFIFGLLSCLLCMGALAQRPDKYLFLGKEAEDQKELIKAADVYEQGVQRNPNNLELHFRYAEVLRFLADYERAEKFYRRSIELDTKNEYPAALYWLALIQKNNEDYSQSLATWELLLRQYEGNRSSAIYKKAQHELEVCRSILKGELPAYSTPIRNILNLNSTSAEFASSYYDSSSLVFSQLPKIREKKDPGNIQLRAAIREKNDWQAFSPLPPQINTPTDQNANGSFSSDGRFFIFSRCIGDDPCQLYISVYKNGSYSKAYPLKTNVQGFTSTQGHLVYDQGKYSLFFSSDRPGGLGGFDIWYTEADSSLNFGRLYNCSEINSPEDEISPFYHPPTRELFFSSTWHAGFGGYDIFKSKRAESGSLAPPQNVGKPFNSPANDLYFTLSPQSYKGTLSSNRAGSLSSFGKTCCNDLYEFDYPLQLIEQKRELPAITNDLYSPLSEKDSESLFKELEQMLPLKLYFHNDEPDPKTNKNYTLQRYTDCYFSYLKVQDQYKMENPEQAESLFNDYVIAGYDKLQRWLDICRELLSRGLSIEVDIKGHASPLALNQYNINLSSRRIETFYNELKKYQDGAMLNYLGRQSGNSLTFRKLPFGEEKAKEGISDDYNNTRLSIYSLDAALERRIELLAIRKTDKNAATAEPERPIASTEELESQEKALKQIEQAKAPAASSPGMIRERNPKQEIPVNSVAEITSSENPKRELNTEVPSEAAEKSTSAEKVNKSKASNPLLDELKRQGAKEKTQVFTTQQIQLNLGRVKRGQQVVKVIRYRNTLGKTINLSKVQANCSCTGLAVPSAILLPDEEIEFTLVYDTRGKIGPQEDQVSILSKESEGTIVISFKMEIVP